MIVPRVSDSRPFVALVFALIASAWLALFAWGASPYGRYISHEALGSARIDSGPGLAAVATSFFGWMLMTVAMMLPTALPLVLLFRRLTGSRENATGLTWAVVGGYLGAWAAVGFGLLAADAALHAAVDQSHWLRDHSWGIAAATLLAAGAYQFSPLKYLCLDECRSPYTFIAGRWQGGNAVRDAIRLGLAHGWFCVGCCWTLMVVMFALGSGSLVWMLGVGAVMLTEKNAPWGRALSTPLGALLLAAGASLVLLNLGLDTACAHDGATC